MNVSILTATGGIVAVEVGVSSPVQAQHLSRYVHQTCNLLRAHLTCAFYTSCLNWFDAHFTTNISVFMYLGTKDHAGNSVALYSGSWLVGSKSPSTS